MSKKKKKTGDYAVGYRKPPKDSQFQKGTSGNPKGRPKNVPDFDSALIRESKSNITFNDNGQRRSISKFEGVVKQLMHKALAGNLPAIRAFLAHYQQAMDRIALLAGPQPTDPEFEIYKHVMNATDEELDTIINDYLKETEQEKRKRERSTPESESAAGEMP
jgi:hypothetical protein